MDHKIVDGVSCPLSKEDLEQRALDEARHKANALDIKISLVKEIARGKITGIAPEWKQLNLIRSGEDTDIWERVDLIRAYSNELEKALEKDLNIDIREGWPE